jgi:hypothetical protein
MPDQNDVTGSDAAATQAAKDTKRDVQQDISEAREEVRHDLSDAADTAKRDLKAARREATDQLGHVQDEATAQAMEVADEARSFVSRQKDMAADELDDVAEAMAKTAEEIDNPTIAGYARELAGGIRKVSEGVRTRSLEEMVTSATDFGRRQPIAFLGAAALAGFAASRFMRASAERRQTPPTPEDEDLPMTPSSTYRPAEAGNTFGDGHLARSGYGETQ